MNILPLLQALFYILLGVLIISISVWSYFKGQAWWLAPIAPLVAYIALLSGLLTGDPHAWNRKIYILLSSRLLSNVVPASISNILLCLFAGLMIWTTYKSMPAQTDYYEVRVYDQVDIKQNFQIGAEVIIHTRTDGLTRKGTVGETGGLLLYDMPEKTNLRYQLQVSRTGRLQRTGGSANIKGLPDILSIDISKVSPKNWAEVEVRPKVPFSPSTLVQPNAYLHDAKVIGDPSFQKLNAPWGLPWAPFIVNRLSYILGYDPEHRIPKWVAFGISSPPARSSYERTKLMTDPALPEDAQGTNNDYAGSGFFRGKMISPGDVTYKGPIINAEIQYFSTVFPQAPGGFNIDLFEYLARYMRKLAPAGIQLYVIAGTAFGTPDRKSTSAIGRNEIAIPTHLYRIVARQTKDGDVEALAFLIPNSRHVMNIRRIADFLVPVKQIEEITGLTFFPFLREEEQIRLKAMKSGDLW